MHLCLKRPHPFFEIHCYISAKEVGGFKVIRDLTACLFKNDLVFMNAMGSHMQSGRHYRLCWPQVQLTFYVVAQSRLALLS